MKLTVDLLLTAYRQGIFPMGDDRFGEAITWHSPDPRAILPLEAFHVPKNVARLVRKGKFEVVMDRDFEAVLRACADRPSTWITRPIVEGYLALYEAGYAHSVECYLEGRLAGGLYGVALGGAFFGESMFHRVRDSSKVALVHLVEHLRRRGYRLLDIQYLTPHLARFGAIEIPRKRYLALLQEALAQPVSWR